MRNHVKLCKMHLITHNFAPPGIMLNYVKLGLKDVNHVKSYTNPIDSSHIYGNREPAHSPAFSYSFIIFVQITTNTNI